MKQLSVIIAVVFLFVACLPAKPKIPKYNKVDSFTLVYTANNSKWSAVGRVDSIYVTPTFKDQLKSLEAFWKLDTTWMIYIQNFKDTLRGVDNKPLYADSAHKTYRFNGGWYKVSTRDTRIQIIY